MAKRDLQSGYSILINLLKLLIDLRISSALPVKLYKATNRADAIEQFLRNRYYD